MAALSVEPLPDLKVEHLKVLSLTVEPACASSPYGRAPPDLNSRACLRILSMAALSVEHLKVLWSSASGPYQSSPLKGP